MREVNIRMRDRRLELIDGDRGQTLVNQVILDVNVWYL